MKTILTLAGLLTAYLGAIFLAILMGAVLGHFTNSIFGALSTFPFAMGCICATQQVQARLDPAQ